MSSEMMIHRINEMNPSQQKSLSELLIRVVEDGASVGFLPPLDIDTAASYWEEVLQPGVMLWIASINDVIAGTVQLQLVMKANGSHRAEIAKLMVHPQYRRNGIGRRLMQTAEAAAKEEGRSLLVLDTRLGDPSNDLYRSLGFMEAGRIPQYARSADGSLDATVFYYKEL